MSKPIRLSRRKFLVSSAAAGGGLALGLHLPSGLTDAAAQKAAATPEVNAWVVIKPNDAVVIRIARSEMGQGTLTGLAQLVVEELECDWSKVATEFPTPGESLARQRVWGEFGTGGSRGIRISQDYVRRGGAVARTMLLQAAAEFTRKLRRDRLATGEALRRVMAFLTRCGYVWRASTSPQDGLRREFAGTYRNGRCSSSPRRSPRRSDPGSSRAAPSPP